MSGSIDTFDKIFTAIIGLAILSVIVSRNAATSAVIQSLTSGLSSLIGVAVSPVTAPASSSGASSSGASSSGNNNQAKSTLASITGTVGGLTSGMQTISNSANQISSLVSQFT